MSEGESLVPAIETGPSAQAGTLSRLRLVNPIRAAWWEYVVAAVGIGGAVAAVVVTLRADFLAFPGWLALQKADLILGPIGVGLYWHRRRPLSRFGPLLIAVGLLQIPYIAESSANPALFTVGLYWETVVYLCTLTLILTFPSGRLSLFPEGLILLFAALGPEGVVTATTLLSSHATPGGSISACLTTCPTNLLVLREDPELALRLVSIARWLTIALASATAGLLVWRFVSGSPPRRRAFAIGTPVALIFLVTQVLNQLARMYGPAGSDFLNYMRWSIVVSRSLIWYGFLLALIAAELFAARVLRTMLSESLRRPAVAELEALLRQPLGDPGLRLAFRQPHTDGWIDAQGRTVQPPATSSGRMLTEVERDGMPAAAIIHDAQLSDDPELLQAAGATALLALENAELQEAWAESLRELSDSRARIATIAANERRNLERDLHDGAQQRLLALRIAMTFAEGQADRDQPHRARLHEFGEALDAAIDELRDLAHGIYPSVLADSGLALALEGIALLAGQNVRFEADGLGRYPSEVESAVYYCCREALQNAVKHAGIDANLSLRLGDDGDELRFEIRDDGAGFDAPGSTGTGLRNMRDRMAALDGRLVVTSAPGHGTLISGALPLRRAGWVRLPHGSVNELAVRPAAGEA